MPEELSPESKLYVKEEIQKSSKEFKGEIEKVKSQTTKVFTTVVIVVGLLTGLGVYGGAKNYINKAVNENLEEAGITELKSKAQELVEKINSHEAQAKKSYNNIAGIETQAEKILSCKMIIGTIVPYGGEIVERKAGEATEVKEGWFFCNGASLDRKKYEDLYNVIRVAFGAPDLDTFNLPDLRGRFVRGVDHGTGRDPDANVRKSSNEGGYDGDKVGSVQNDALRTHSHPLKTIYKHYRSFVGADGSDHPLKASSKYGGDKEWLASTDIYGEKETRPKNVYVNWIIKAK